MYVSHNTDSSFSFEPMVVLCEIRNKKKSQVNSDTASILLLDKRLSKNLVISETGYRPQL